MELTLWIFGGAVLLLYALFAVITVELNKAINRLRNDLEVFVSDVNTHGNITRQRLRELEKKRTIDVKHIDTLYSRINELQESVSKLERSKQSEIRANYNNDFSKSVGAGQIDLRRKDFSHIVQDINTDI